MGTESQDNYSKNVDRRTEEEKAIDAWLPISSSRNAKWWYAAFHNVTAMVGAGVLGLPYAMSELGWGPGVAVMVISWIVTLYTLWQMVEMHEMVPGKRFDRYHELGQHAFGEKLGLYIVVPQQLVVEVGVDIVYMVTGGKSLKKFHDLVCGENCKDIKLTFFIMIFASVHFVLSHLPNFNSISGVSLAAAVMSLRYIPLQRVEEFPWQAKHSAKFSSVAFRLVHSSIIWNTCLLYLFVCCKKHYSIFCLYLKSLYILLENALTDTMNLAARIW